jgi:hypothetical protein
VEEKAGESNVANLTPFRFGWPRTVETAKALCRPAPRFRFCRGGLRVLQEAGTTFCAGLQVLSTATLSTRIVCMLEPGQQVDQHDDQRQNNPEVPRSDRNRESSVLLD